MALKDNSLEALLADGFTKRMADEYLMLMDRENKSGFYDKDFLEWAHSHGFFAEDAIIGGVNDNNIDDYLSDYDFWKLWPLNSWERIWINDKLTLNALVQDSDLQKYVPAYYYYTGHTSPDGLLPLNGSGYAPGMEGVIDTLKKVGDYACKPCNGTMGEGFHHLVYKNGAFGIDGEEVTQAGIEDWVKAHRNFVFTEFIRPAGYLAEINPLIHTIRVVYYNITGADPQPSSTYFRFALDSGKTGAGCNYDIPKDLETAAYDCYIDPATGEYGQGKLVYLDRVVNCPEHPISGKLAEGVVPQWDEFLDMMKRFSYKVGACDFLGFDAAWTEKGPMIMEINSHPGIKYMQVYKPIMTEPIAGEYFRQKLAAIDALDEAGKKRRNTVVR